MCVRFEVLVEVKLARTEFAHRTHLFHFRDLLLKQLSSHYESNDVYRLTLAYVAVFVLVS